MLGSYLWRTPRSPDLDPNVVARDVRRKIGNAVVTAQNGAQVASDLTVMAIELGEIVGERIFGGASASGSGNQSAIDRLLDLASPLTIAVLDMVAEAVADLSPRKRATYLGW